MSSVSSVVLVHRLREVIAQVGFTRFESMGTDINGELPDKLSLDIKVAPLAREADWVPAVENRGEGLFIEFDAASIFRPHGGDQSAALRTWLLDIGSAGFTPS